jgi:hypothetical protein
MPPPWSKTERARPDVETHDGDCTRSVACMEVNMNALRRRSRRLPSPSLWRHLADSGTGPMAQLCGDHIAVNRASQLGPWRPRSPTSPTLRFTPAVPMVYDRPHSEWNGSVCPKRVTGCRDRVDATGGGSWKRIDA